MRARNLLVVAGAALPALAQGLLPPNAEGNSFELTKSTSERTKSNSNRDDGGHSSSRPSYAEPRRLQLHLRDASGEDTAPRSAMAYAALLMNDHDRGIRTLGQSLIDSRTAADLVAILGAGVTTATEVRMRAQGWRIRRLTVDGGKDGFDMDSAGGLVLAHASVWALTEYERVVLLSDSMLVVENIDDLFQCPGICAAMQQAEVIGTSLIVLEPDLETYRHMSQAVGRIFSFSNDFKGFLNSYYAGFETCALFDLENPALPDPSTDPNRDPLDHSCHRLPTRYNGDLLLVMLNGGLGMVRTKNAMPEEWWRQRRARVVRFEFAGLRPWMWFASPFLPFVSAWESTHLRALPGDPTPNMFWAVLVWFLFVAAFVRIPSLDLFKSDASFKSAGGCGWAACVPWSLSWSMRRRGGSITSGSPRGLLWGLAHLSVGYASLSGAVMVGVSQVPAASSVKLSWIVFITWTSTVFGMLWSFYLWLILPHYRPLVVGNGDLKLAAIQATLCAGGSTDAFKPKMADVDVGGLESVPKVGGVGPPSPWIESVRSLALFAAVLAFLPAWKPLSGAASLPTLLGPAALALVAMFVGLTVQMVRLPVLWFDHLKFLSLREKEGL